MIFFFPHPMKFVLQETFPLDFIFLSDRAEINLREQKGLLTFSSSCIPEQFCQHAQQHKTYRRALHGGKACKVLTL